MLYLIKSPKWTKYYKKDTYWGTNKCGYVTIIADAGFYEDKEAQEIIRLSGKNGAELVPVTRKILDKAYRQLRKIRKDILTNRQEMERRYIEYMNESEKKENANDNAFDSLEQIAEQLGI